MEPTPIYVYLVTQQGCEHCENTRPVVSLACKLLEVEWLEIPVEDPRYRRLVERLPTPEGKEKRATYTPVVLIVEGEGRNQRVLRRWDGEPERDEFLAELRVATGK